ncbi:MAG: LiaF transmembrane domain-containing protein [Bacteroidales bacterium]
MKTNNFNGRVILGIVLILVGLALIAKSSNILSPVVEHALFNWPMLLIVLGVLFVFTRTNNTTGWILLLIGLMFWIPRVTDFSVNFTQIFLPVVFIAIGVVIVIKSLGNSEKQPKEGYGKDYIDDVAILGGNDRRITSHSFRGGKITSVLGGSTVNLSDAELAQGESVLDMFTLFGGTTIIVPRNWQVKVDVTAILGGFEDKRQYIPDENQKNEKILIVKGIAIFGGGEIKSV